MGQFEIVALLDAEATVARSCRKSACPEASNLQADPATTLRHRSYRSAQRQPRADPLDVCENGQDRRLDGAIGAKSFCVVTHELGGLPETWGNQGLGCAARKKMSF